MADSLEMGAKISQFIKESLDFVTEEQLKLHFELVDDFTTPDFGFFDFYTVDNFSELLEKNEIIMFMISLDSNKMSKFALTEEEWNQVLGDENQRYPIFFISSSNYSRMLISMIEILLEKNNFELRIPTLIGALNEAFVEILGLQNFIDLYRTYFVSTAALRDVLLTTERFSIKGRSKFSSFLDSALILNAKYLDPEKELTSLSSLFNAFYSLKTDKLPFEKLCLYLNMDREFTSIPKPVRSDELKNLISKYHRFLISGETVQLVTVREFLSSNSLQFERFENIPHNWRGEGLLIFKFVGKPFPLEIAQSYVELRPFIYFSIEKEFDQNKLNDIKMYYPELAQFFDAFLFDVPVENWIRDHLRVSFISDNFGHLQTYFDLLLKDFSPVCNVGGNPGNLFKGIIEDKIRERQVHNG